MTPDPYVPHRGSSAYRVLRYELDLDYRVATNALSGRAVLHVELQADLDVLELDLVGLGVDRVLVDGVRPLRHRQRDGRLLVTLAEPERAGARLLVDVRYSGSPGPQRGPWGEVGWEELTDGVLVAGQPDGAPTWFPCNDLPSEKAAFSTTVRVDSAYRAVANGVLLAEVRGGSRTTWTWEQAEPMAPYLATLQVGRYDVVDLPSRTVRQQLVHPPRLRQRATADASRQDEMVALFVDRFGPYPFADYTLVVTDDDLEIPLEAQGLSVFGANHVDGAGGSERLFAHELAHQWFGNSVTAASWCDVWLHEGPACYAEWLWSEQAGGPTADALARSWHGRLARQPQDLLLADPGAARMFDDRVYKRGALTLHALRRTTGDDAFFGLLRGWTTAHRHATVTTRDFVAHAVEHGGPDLALLLSRWLERPELPQLP